MASPLQALRRLSAAGLTLLLSRAEFASLELAQAREQLLRWAALALAAALLALLALMAVSALAVLLLWPAFGPLTLIGLALLYLLAGWLLLRRLNRELREAPPLFAETLKELEQDRDALFGAQAAEPKERG